MHSCRVYMRGRVILHKNEQWMPGMPGLSGDSETMVMRVMTCPLTVGMFTYEKLRTGRKDS